MAADDVVLHGSASESVRGTVVGGFTGGVLVGVASVGAPVQFVRYRRLIAAGADRKPCSRRPTTRAGPPGSHQIRRDS